MPLDVAFIYDGHIQISGVSGASPSVVPRNFCSRAVNRSFRWDENAPRPAFVELDLEFLDDTDGNNAKLFRAGNIQGATFYHSYPTFLTPYIVVSMAGTIFTIQIIGNKGYVRKLFTGNDPVFTHAWYGQAFNWLVIQDGTAKPILWDGTNPARRAVDGEVPTGSLMAFIHGRLAVASSDGTNQIAVGDIVYGNDATTTNDVIKFTETQYWANGGAFGAPVYVGDIMGMEAMAYLDIGTGQNELVVLGTEGAVSLDLSRPRSEWLDSSILRISLIGGGCVSTHSPVKMNGDLLFRSQEGIRSYRNARSEFQQTWRQTPISSDVRQWISYDSPALLQYASQASWNNMLFSTCAPRIAPANNPFAGHHRFHLGFVVMDAWPESNTIREGASVWHGMWTGIRPVQFVAGNIRGVERCFAFSYDCDGRNRLYEITPGRTRDVVGGKQVKIRSSYDTGELGTIERVSNSFMLKRLGGGMIEMSGVREEMDVTVKYRPDNSVCWMEMDRFNLGCDCQPLSGECESPFTQPRQARRHFKSPDTRECAPDTKGPAIQLYHTQARVEMVGYGKVERMRFKFTQQEDAETVECNIESCKRVDCCEEEYYNLVECGVNPDVPEIERPSDINQFVAQATVTLSCPTGTFGAPVTVTTSATSDVSYEDAYQKAVLAATAQANAALDCCTCTPENAISFVSNSSTEDLSAFFDSGAYADTCGNRPWRLIETVTEIEYANGYVDSGGTLVVVWTLPGYETYFDSETKQFVDGGVTDAFMALQLGCSQDGVAQWPETPDYFSP